MPVLWVVDRATDALLYQIVADLSSEMPDDKYLVADPVDRVSLIPPPPSQEEV